MNRRQLIKGIGTALCAGAAVPFLPQLLAPESPDRFIIGETRKFNFGDRVVGVDCGIESDFTVVAIDRKNGILTLAAR